MRDRRGSGPAVAWLGLLLTWLALSAAALAQTAEPAPWVDAADDGARRVHLYYFWSATCPHCEAAHPFVEAIPGQRPWVALHSFEVSRDRDNARRFEALAGSLGQRAEAVPTLLFCGRMLVGWQDAATSGTQLLAALDACRADDKASPPAAETMVQVPVFGAVAPGSLSLPLVTVVIAGLDAFNPCAFFVLLFLLSLLARQQNRRRMLAVGGIFVAASGLMYFAFMAAWLNVFQLLGGLGGITLAAGLVAVLVGAINIKDFFAFEEGITLSIPAVAKPGIYRRARAILAVGGPAALLAATVFLAVAANFYELLCTAGFPMVYTRLLTLGVPSPAARYAWLAVYNVIYIAPLLLVVLVFVGTLSARKLSEREGRLLKLLSGAMMLELGLLLAFVPEWLNGLAATAALVLVAFAVTFVAARLTRPAPPA